MERRVDYDLLEIKRVRQRITCGNDHWEAGSFCRVRPSFRTLPCHFYDIIGDYGEVCACNVWHRAFEP